MRKRLTNNFKMSVLIIGCLVMTLSLSACAKAEAKKDYEALSSEISQLQVDISNKIHEGESVLTDTKTEDLTDSTLLEALKKQIDSAKADTVNVPTIGSETDEIKQQIEDLTGKKEKLQSQLDSLSSSISAIGDSKQKMVEQIAAEKEAKLNEAIYPNNTYSIIATDHDGNKQKITIKIGQWLKGSETELLDKAWKKVGGDAAMPLTGTYEGNGVLPGGTINPKEGAYVFGSMSIENLTPDFDPESFNKGDIFVGLDPQYGSFGGEFVSVCEYSTGVSCDLMASCAIFVGTEMTSNNWGPMPFVIGAEHAFTPNYPEGDPALNEVEFSFTSRGAYVKEVQGDKTFKIKKSW